MINLITHPIVVEAGKAAAVSILTTILANIGPTNPKH